jgi:hypothetical protein
VLPKLAPFYVADEPLHMEDYFQLVCSPIHGDSPFKFEWVFKNTSIENFFEIRIENTKRSSTLSIESVAATHSGEYTCKVSNIAGSTSITTALVVKGWSTRIV